MNYTTIVHHNSNTSRRRGLLKKFNMKTGRVEAVDHNTIQVVRGGNGKLPHTHSPAVVRSFRSKYDPHVGRKQVARLAKFA